MYRTLYMYIDQIIKQVVPMFTNIRHTGNLGFLIDIIAKCYCKMHFIIDVENAF